MLGEAFAREFFAGGAQGDIPGEIIAARDGVDIHPRAAAEDGHGPAGADVGVGPQEVLLELPDIVLLPGLGDVDEVVGDGAVLGEVLARADVHAAIDLAGIRRNDLPAELFGQGDGVARLAGGRGAEHDDEVAGAGGIVPRKLREIKLFRDGQLCDDAVLEAGHGLSLFPFRAGCPSP